jgi:Tol biopolymer transport system component
MSLPRPGRSGALTAALAVILAALLIADAFLLLQPVPAAPSPAELNPVARTSALGAVARISQPRIDPAIVNPPAADPPGPDTPGITSLVSAWNPAATTTIRGGEIGSSLVYVASTGGFAIGDAVVFGATLAKDKIATIEGNLVELGQPLAASLPIGTSMVRATASPSSQPAISADGRYVVYASTATTIVPGVGDGTSHVYEFDRTTGSTRLISGSTITANGKPEQLPPGSQAVQPSVNADGSVIAYVLTTPAIVGAAIVPGGSFVVVHDNGSGEDVELAPGSHPSVSGSARFVALETTTALVPALDSNKLADVYVIDRTSGNATLASVAANGRAPAAASGGPSLSADASSVAFTSAARLLSADHDPASDVYVRVLATARTVLVSVHGGADSGASTGASTSGDGRYVAFSSHALTLASGPEAGGGSLADLYVRDVSAKKTIRLSRAVGGGPADGSSNGAAIAADGRTIAFASNADDLVPGDTNKGVDVFVADRLSGRITRASIDSSDHQAGPASSAPALSQDASILAFQSTATNLAAGAHGSTDVYLRIRLPRAEVSPAALPFPARPVGSTSPPELVTVRSVGAGPLVVTTASLAGANPTAFTITTDGCSGAALEHGETCTIGVSFRPTAPGTSLASLVVTDTDSTGSQTVSLDGGTLKPTIVLDPSIGPAGFVTTASGTNFPPGAIVTLAWSVGLTASMPAVVADSSGSFTVPMLILPRDTLGQRILTGTFTASGGGSAQSPPFLVVPGTGQPPFDAPRIPGQPPEQIFRR